MLPRIVVTGIGPICSIAHDGDELWKAIVSKKTSVAINECFVDDRKWGEFYSHKLNNFHPSNFIKNKLVMEWISEWKNKKQDIDLELIASSIALAINDSQLELTEDTRSAGLVLVHENQGFENFVNSVVDATHDFYTSKKGEKFFKLDVVRYLTEKCDRIGYDSQSFMYLFFVAKLFNIHGYSLFLNNACSSGLFGIDIASQQIKLGKLNTVIVAGADYPRYMYKYLWFDKLNMYAKDGLMKPFSSKSNGLVFGEGASAIVLENYDVAKSRGAKIYAEYMGGGFSLESSKVSLPNLGSNLYADTIREAINNSNMRPEDIDLVIPHGVSNRVTDLHEADALHRVFGHVLPMVTALKPYIGHNLGNSSLIELCILFLSMKNQYIPATLNTDELDSKAKINLITIGRKASIKRALKLSCGFAGYNAAAVFMNHN